MISYKNTFASQIENKLSNECLFNIWSSTIPGRSPFFVALFSSVPDYQKIMASSDAKRYVYSHLIFHVFNPESFQTSWLVSFEPIHANKLLSINAQLQDTLYEYKVNSMAGNGTKQVLFYNKIQQIRFHRLFFAIFFLFISFVFSSLTDFKWQWWWTLKHFSSMLLFHSLSIVHVSVYVEKR